MMTNEIDDVLRNDLFTKSIFEGVYALDKVPTNLQHNAIYVINLDKSKEKGSHWTALKIDREQVIYFDSLARPPPKEIVPKMYKIGKDILYADIPIQSILSQVCGYHVLLVCLFWARGWSLKEIMTEIYKAQEKKYLRNDYLAVKVISSLTNLKERPLIDWMQIFP